MSNDGDDARGRQETTPFDQQVGGPPDPGQQAPPHGQQYGPQYGQPQYGQQYGQPQYGQPSYPAQYPQQWGSPQYGQPPYGTAPYGGAPYGPPPQPARPGTVITAAVLGLVLGALGLLATVGLLVGGALIDDLAAALDESDPSLGSGVANDVRAVLLLLALLALAWTVVMVWGSVLALRQGAAHRRA